ncbi:MAG: GNAT family N-acetyltransferase [Euryarchaeota archaeon]|nr:GNAT family N-acetyltransferase [Euryarchaeota archaeon]
MPEKTHSRDPARKPHPSSVPGLVYRTYKGTSDNEAIADVMNRSWEADLVDSIISVSDVAAKLARRETFDPARDMMILDTNGTVIGMCEVSWARGLNNITVYMHRAHLLPEWRHSGIRESMFELNEARIRDIAASHDKDRTKVFEVYANSEPNEWKALLEKNGYSPSWYLLAMLRPLAESIPDLPLPNGVEVRPARPEQYRTIWDAAAEAMRDERTFTEEERNGEAFERYVKSSNFSPDLWQIAWEGDQVAGGVQNYIDENENIELKRRWGHTEDIFVRRRWRRKGLAHALIARSYRLLKEKGMEYAALDMEAENLSGALRLYESLGYKKDKEFIFFRKPL